PALGRICPLLIQNGHELFQHHRIIRYDIGGLTIGATMRRREFITLISGATAIPLVAAAQQPERVRRFGVLMSTAANDPVGQARIAAFRQGLQKLGWTEGQNVRIDIRWAGGMQTSIANSRRNWSRLPQMLFWPQRAQLWRPCKGRAAPC